MGKDAKHQRTKKGVQPSSSSRTAELLEKSGGGSGGALSFMAAAAEAQMEFGATSIQPATTVLASLLIEDDLPPEVKMVFRKLQKKDATTKVKALAELGQLLGGPPSASASKEGSPSSSREPSVERSSMTSPEELSKVLLPHWIKAYQNLVLDDSRKVREQAQITLALVCKNVGRNLAPLLKQLMPSWYLAQHDLYKPVASGAKKAFRTVFISDTKQAEVVKFCRDEILRLMVDHLQTSFRGGKRAEQSGHKEKKQKGKKKGQGEDVTHEQESVAAEGEGKSSASTGPSYGDAETLALRLTCSALSSLKSLIDLGLVDFDVMEEVFGEQGLFWGSCDLTKELLVRRGMYDTLSSLSNYLRATAIAAEPKEVSPSPPFQIPAPKCTKFINAALSSNQKETLPNLWNTFLLLTLNGTLSDIQLARKQLVTCCKNGFYGNASQIGSSVLPLLSRIWEGFQDNTDQKQEFSSDLIASTITGYGLERSLFEKAAIARTLGGIVAFLCKEKVIEMGPVYNFIFSNLSNLTSDFPKLYGNYIKDQEYYDGLLDYCYTNCERDSYNSKDFGSFLVNICSQTDSQNIFTPQRPSGFRKVKFQDSSDDCDMEGGDIAQAFDALPEQKRLFLQTVIQKCVEAGAFKPITAICRKFKTPQLWNRVNILEIDASGEEDKVTRLRLYLSLISLHPEAPPLLAKFSNEFEHFQEGPGLSNFANFLKEMEPFIKIQPIRRWVRMPHFITFVITSLQSGKMAETELKVVMKFVLRSDLFPADVITQIVETVSNRIASDPIFFDIISHILSCSNFDVDLTKIYRYYWDCFVLKSLAPATAPEELELLESTCFKNLGKLDPAEISVVIEKYLDSCVSVKQIDVLVEITKRLGFSGEILKPLPQSQLQIKPDVLAFLGVNYKLGELTNDGAGTDQVPKFTRIHSSSICRAIYKAKLLLTTSSSELEATDLIIPILNVSRAQALVKVWQEGQKSSYFDLKLPAPLVTKLDVVSSRLLEKVYEDKQAWKQLWEEIDNRETNSGDALLDSRLPSRILLEYCRKAELIPGNTKMTPKTSPEEVSFSSQTSQVLDNLAKGFFTAEEVIPWITEKRVKSPEDFEFDPLFKHMKNKGFVNNLVLITSELLDKVVNDDEMTEEFLSLGACWISAWLKLTKYIDTNSKQQLLFVTNLARAVKVISDKARNLDQLCPKFVLEYVEFHSSQLYPVMYSIYIQLNEEVPSHNFWTLQTLFYVSDAVSTCPANTLAFIEPDSYKLCETFGKIVGNGESLSTRIAAYRILKKVRYDRSGEDELPIIPSQISGVIKTCLQKMKKDDYDDVDLISYLLIWDALLKIQQGCNEFATYVRDQEHLLTSFLNTVFFSERISLENASSTYFEKDVEINPGSPVSILKLACSVVHRALRNLPYTVRWWWNNQVTRQRERVFVEKFIVKYLSSSLAAEELGSVKLRGDVDDNVTIHCHSGCNELIAHYRIEETNVTLTVSLPLNHPLGPVTVKISDKKLHGKISHLLNTRSHSLSAGLKLWKENLDGLYKDVDECMICFSILHGVTKQIPKLGCKTCKKKFHAGCLYKWFSTSNKSECPLCRNLF